MRVRYAGLTAFAMARPPVTGLYRSVAARITNALAQVQLAPGDGLAAGGDLQDAVDVVRALVQPGREQRFAVEQFCRVQSADLAVDLRGHVEDGVPERVAAAVRAVRKVLHPGAVHLAEDADPAHGGTKPSAYPDQRSGLIWPSHDGWGVFSAMVFWAADPRAVEYRARFVRDPLNAKQYDSTATNDSTITRDGQYRMYLWQMFVHRGRPLGLKVPARGLKDAKIKTAITLAEFKTAITLAEFKLAIHTDVATP